MVYRVDADSIIMLRVMHAAKQWPTVD